MLCTKYYLTGVDRIPHIEKYNIKEKVELVLEKGYLILKPISTPRKGWETSFKEMNKNGDDQLLFNDVFENENPEEWI